MRKNMLRLARFITLVIFSFFSSPLSGFLRPGPFDLVFDTQFLYLLPSIDDTSFVLRGTDANGNESGDLHHNDFEFQPAFRIGVGLGTSRCRDVFFHYTFLHEKQNKTITGSGLWATQGDIVLGETFDNYTGFASSHLNLMYQQFELLFSRQILPGNPMNLNFLLGFEIPNLRLAEKIIYQSAALRGEITRQNNTWGIGPEFGFEVDYDYFGFTFWRPSCFMITGAVRGALLAGRVHQNSQSDSLSGTGITFEANNPPTWRVIPALHAKVGLNYALFCTCCATALEIGYEFTSYFRGLGRIIQHGEFTALEFTNYYNFDLQGLYVALDFGF